MALLSRVAAVLLATAGLVAVICMMSSGDVGGKALRAGRRLQMQAGQMGAGGQVFQGGMQQGAQFTNNVGGQVMQTGQTMADNGYQYGSQAVNQAGAYGNTMSTASSNPAELLAEKYHLNGIGGIPFYVFQIIFAVIYGCTVVNNYPNWQGPNPMSAELQAQPAPCATTRTSPSNCCLSWCCPQARAAHTFDKTGTLEYWCGCLAMFICPFCTLCFTNACTDLNAKLGGQDQNPVMAAICTWLCFCCTIAQDAESLDLATGASTTPCGVQMNYPQGMGPQQMYMQQQYY